MDSALSSPHSLWTALERNSRISPQRTAIRYGNGELTYHELAGQVSSICYSLKALGLEPGETVGCFLPKIPELVIAFLATLKARAVYVPLNVDSAKNTLIEQLRVTRPRFVFVDGKHQDYVDSVVIQAGVPTKVALISTSSTPSKSSNILYSWSILLDTGTLEDYDDHLLTDDKLGMLAYLNYTSGSTGAPKCAVTSHANIYWNSLSAITTLSLQSSDVHLCAFPSHLHPHEILARSVYLGSTIVLSENTVPSLLEAVQRQKVTCMMANPAVYALLAQYCSNQSQDLEHLHLAESGGSLTPSRLRYQYKAELGVDLVPVWGSTETCGIAIAASTKTIDRDRLLGQPCPFYDVKVINDFGEPANIGETGELVIAGNGVCTGYFEDSVASESHFGLLGYHTRDLVSMDSENNVYFQGRAHDMIKTGGLKVHPVEVEEVIRSHPFVQDVVVVGIEDTIRGEIVKAIVVPNIDKTVSTREIVQHCIGKLEDYKLPRLIKFVTELPRSSNGKIDRTRLREM